MRYEIEGKLLSDIGDAIREKTGKSELILPGDMPGEINNIKANNNGIYAGEEDPTINIGNDGDYYYKRSNLIELLMDHSNYYSSTSIATTTGVEFSIINNDITIDGIAVLLSEYIDNVEVLLTSLDGDIIQKIATHKRIVGTGIYGVGFFNRPYTLKNGEGYVFIATNVASNAKVSNKYSPKYISSNLKYMYGRYNYTPPGQNVEKYITNRDTSEFGLVIPILRGNILTVVSEYYRDNNTWNVIS